MSTPQELRSRIGQEALWSSGLRPFRRPKDSRTFSGLFKSRVKFCFAWHTPATREDAHDCKLAGAGRVGLRCAGKLVGSGETLCNHAWA